MASQDVHLKAIDLDFETVKLLLRNGELVTRSVDAYCLSIIKAERQARRLFTYLCYQSSFFSVSNKKFLIESLAAKCRIYFEGFDKGVERMIGVGLELLAGQNRPNWTPYRNKLFHGQISGTSMDRSTLERHSAGIESWCRALYSAGRSRIGYGGFERNSLRKSGSAAIVKQVTSCIPDGSGFEQLLRKISRQNHK